MASKLTLNKIAENLIPAEGRKFVREKILLSKQNKPKINPVDQQQLIDFYSEDVKKLEKIVQKKLPWPNFTR